VEWLRSEAERCRYIPNRDLIKHHGRPYLTELRNAADCGCRRRFSIIFGRELNKSQAVLNSRALQQLEEKDLLQPVIFEGDAKPLYTRPTESGWQWFRSQH